MPGPRNQFRPFTQDDKKCLVRYIATRNPDGCGRSGRKLYEDLVNNSDRWPWAKGHTAQSWREKYVKNRASFDADIRIYQKRKNIDPKAPVASSQSVPRKAKTSQPAATARSRKAKREESEESEASDDRGAQNINKHGKRVRGSDQNQGTQVKSTKRARTEGDVHSRKNQEGPPKSLVIKPFTPRQKARRRSTPTKDAKGKGRAIIGALEDSEESGDEEAGPVGPEDYNGEVFSPQAEPEPLPDVQEDRTLVHDAHSIIDVDSPPPSNAIAGPSNSPVVPSPAPRRPSPAPIHGGYGDSSSGHSKPQKIRDNDAPVVDLMKTAQAANTTAAPTSTIQYPRMEGRAAESSAKSKSPGGKGKSANPPDNSAIHISQEPTPPRSGVSVTPRSSSIDPVGGPASNANRLQDHDATGVAATKPSKKSRQQEEEIISIPSSLPSLQKVKTPARQVGLRARARAPTEDPFTTASTASDAAVKYRKPREPPHWEEGPFLGAHSGVSGSPRFSSGGRRISGVEDSEDWPPKRKKHKSTSAVIQNAVVSPNKPQEPLKAVHSRVPPAAVGPLKLKKSVSRSIKPGSERIFPKSLPAAVPPNGGPAAIAPQKPAHENAEASSSKTLLPAAQIASSRSASVRQASRQPVARPSKPSTHPRASSLAPGQDPFSKDYNSGRDRRSNVKGKEKADDVVNEGALNRRKTFAAFDVPHLNLINVAQRVRLRDSGRMNARQSEPLDLHGRMSVDLDASSRRRSISVLSGAPDGPFAHDSGRSASVSSRVALDPAINRRMSASDLELVFVQGLESVIRRMADNHGFSEAVVWSLWEKLGDLQKTDDALRVMREEAQRGLDRHLQEIIGQDELAIDDPEDDAEDPAEEDDAEEEADVAHLVIPRSERDSSASRHSPVRRSTVPTPSVLSPTLSGTRSPERRMMARNGLVYTPGGTGTSDDGHRAPYSPASETRARQYRRLMMDGREEEAKRREKHRVSLGYDIGMKNLTSEESGAGDDERVEQQEEERVIEEDEWQADQEDEGMEVDQKEQQQVDGWTGEGEERGEQVGIDERARLQAQARLEERARQEEHTRLEEERQKEAQQQLHERRRREKEQERERRKAETRERRRREEEQARAEEAQRVEEHQKAEREREEAEILKREKEEREQRAREEEEEVAETQLQLSYHILNGIHDEQEERIDTMDVEDEDPQAQGSDAPSEDGDYLPGPPSPIISPHGWKPSRFEK